MTNLILTVLAVGLIWIAISAANKSGAKSPIDALQHVSGFATSMVLLLALMIFALPMMIGYMRSKALPQYWGPVITELWDDGLEAKTTAADFMDGRSSLTRPEFTTESYSPKTAVTPIVTNPLTAVENTPAEPVVVQSGVSHTVTQGETLKGIADQYNVSVEEIVAKNGISNPNSISVGDTFVIQDEVVVIPTVEAITAPTSTPSPTATPMRDWSYEFNQIESAKSAGDITTGVEIINTILRSEPNNVVARAYQQEIQIAYDVVSEWEALVWGANSASSQSEVESALAGFEFKVDSLDDHSLFKMKQEREMVLICTSPNWLNGRKVEISRFIGEQLGFYTAGDRLTVEG